MLYAFAFNNLSSKILYQLIHIDHRFILWPYNIDHYLQLVIQERPEYILGIGMYSGKDQQEIRIETKVNNKFRNSSLEANSPHILPLAPFLKPITRMKLSSGLGNSWCNLISWKINQLINQGKLDSEYTFLHIPNSFPQDQAVTLIEQLLVEYNLV